MKYLFKEVNLNKKKEKIINIYENIIKKNNYRSKNILFLVPNSITKLNYMRDINLPFSEELKITTYSHFVQSELIKYWPIVVKNCNQIKKEKISPSFISPSLSEYIIKSYIKKMREEENYFEDIVGTDKSICRNIIDNLSKACFNNFDINSIGENLKKYDVIINTVPHIILNEERLKHVKKDCLLIDLASNPGGIDKTAVKDNQLKFVWALSLPGKVAPTTSAEFIKDTIYNIIKEIYK